MNGLLFTYSRSFCTMKKKKYTGTSERLMCPITWRFKTETHEVCLILTVIYYVHPLGRQNNNDHTFQRCPRYNSYTKPPQPFITILEFCNPKTSLPFVGVCYNNMCVKRAHADRRSITLCGVNHKLFAHYRPSS